MLKYLTAPTILCAFAFPALAEGDPEKGKDAFNQCQTCHVVANEAGDVLAGRNARTGPNLYGVAGFPVAGVEGFRYGNGLTESREKGLVWDEESFVAYLQNPTGFVREYLGNNRARGNMSFQVRSEETARDLFAFLVSIGPELPADEEGEGEGEASTTN